MRIIRGFKRNVLTFTVAVLVPYVFPRAAMGLDAGPLAPPACENAALVYYQAFIASERVRDRWHIKIDGFNGGQELTEDIRKLVTQDTFRYPIELAKAAMQIPVCDWGLLSSGPYRGDKLVDDKARGLATLFSTDGRFLAFEGQYRPALERAGELGRLASHVGDDTYFMWMTSVRVNSRAFRLVQDCPGRDAAGCGYSDVAEGAGCARPARQLAPERNSE